MRLKLLLAMILGLARCGAWAMAGDVPASRPSGGAVAINRFSADLYGRVDSGKRNLVYSPLSIYSALMMTAGGARGETAAEMSEALGSGDVASAEVQAAAGDLLARIGKPNQDFQLHIASAIWAQEGFKCLPAFQNILEKDYRAKLMGIDFRDPARASGAINDWVAGETAGKITELFSPRSLAPDTRMVLANAIYFQSGLAAAVFGGVDA